MSRELKAAAESAAEPTAKEAENSEESKDDFVLDDLDLSWIPKEASSSLEVDPSNDPNQTNA